MYFKTEKYCYFEWYKKTSVCRPEIGPKHFDKL